MKLVAIAGRRRGSTMLTNMPKGVAPSMNADSSISRGTVLMNPVRRKTGRGQYVAV